MDTVGAACWPVIYPPGCFRVVSWVPQVVSWVPQNGFIGRTPELRPPLEETRARINWWGSVAPGDVIRQQRNFAQGVKVGHLPTLPMGSGSFATDTQLSAIHPIATIEAPMSPADPIEPWWTKPGSRAAASRDFVGILANADFENEHSQRLVTLTG